MESSDLSATQKAGNVSPGAVAPAWHTIILLTVLLGFSLLGAIASHRAPERIARAHPVQYVVTIGFEWLVVAFVWWGVTRRRASMADLIGGRWPHISDVLRDIGIGVGFLVVASIVLQIVGYMLGAAPNQAIKNMLPQGRTELILWVLLSMTAGFCEEVIFRGYLQRQFAALTQSAAGGVVLQGIAFGTAHGYQGWKLMVVISVYGVMFGLLKQWRHSTRPGMITHGLQDTLGGLFGRHLMR